MRDTDGVELAGAEQAQAYAIRFAGQCLADDPGISAGHDFRVEVRNADGLMLLTITAFLTDAPALPSERAIGKLR